MKIAQIHKEAGLIDNDQSVDDFSQALRSIGEPIINLKAKDISMGRVLVQLFDITKQKLDITSFNDGKINTNVNLNEKRF